MSIKYRELKRCYELDGAAKTVDHLAESIREKHFGRKTLASATWRKRWYRMGISGCECWIRDRARG